jgi:RimJ/RimL family protein N-acetyltransferase
MMGRACPILTTPRLTLRPHSVEDFDDMIDVWRDPAVIRHLGGAASTPEEVWARLLRYGGMWSLLGIGFWVVRETATGRFVGEVGVMELRREVEPSLIGAPEAGWVLASWAHGRGFAREATSAMLEWADTRLQAPRTVCMIDPANTPSLVLAARLGYQRFADSRYRGKSIALLERVRPASLASSTRK